MTKAGKPIHWNLVLGFCLFVVVSAPFPAAASTAQPEAPAIDFFDSGSFDRKLSAALRNDPPTVRVNFPAPITVNGIPERLDKWFSQVEQFGGTVELKPEEESTRGIISAIIDLIIGAYKLAREKMIYGPVEDYNAEIWYQKSDGAITKVLFVRKREAGPGG